MHDMYIRDLMTRNVCCVDTDAALQEVLELMREHSFSCIVITDGDKPAGIITERDMVKILAEIVSISPIGKLRGKDFMSKRPVCLHQSATLYEALVITNTRRVRHLPVVNDKGKLVGLVTQSDISQAYFVEVEKQRTIIEQEIQDRTRELAEANEELKALALQDPLLRIGNRRAMAVDLHFTHVNALRYCRPYAVAMVEVDHFGSYIGSYGDAAGSEILVTTVDCMRQSLRASDRVYRYGGEKFMALMPETTLFEAVEAVHRILENMAIMAVEHRKSPFKTITLSAGISSFSEASLNVAQAADLLKPEDDSEAWEVVVAEASKYLDQANELGCNQAAWQVDDQPANPSYSAQRLFGFSL